MTAPLVRLGTCPKRCIPFRRTPDHVLVRLRARCGIDRGLTAVVVPASRFVLARRETSGHILESVLAAKGTPGWRSANDFISMLCSLLGGQTEVLRLPLRNSLRSLLVVNTISSRNHLSANLATETQRATSQSSRATTKQAPGRKCDTR